MKYEHIIRAFAREPWAIDPDKGRQIAIFLAFAASGGKYTAEERAARIGAREARSIRERSGGVAIIPIHGIMSQRVSNMSEISGGGGVSSEATARAVDEAAADDSIKAMILHIDSPGGSVHGIQELAATIRAAREVKPVIAQVDSMALSAGFWAAAQATEIVSTPGGDVGSVGVWTAHQDLSAQMEMIGVKETLISAGEFKTEGNPLEPLSDEGLAHIQARVDSVFKDFIGDLSAGRGVSSETVEQKFGQGRTLRARDALKAGMIDRISTFQETLGRFQRPQKDISRTRALRSAQAVTTAGSNIK